MSHVSKIGEPNHLVLTGGMLDIYENTLTHTFLPTYYKLAVQMYG